MTTKPTTRKSSAKPSPARRSGTPGQQGTLTKSEVQNLVLQAKDAYAYQLQLGRIEPGQSCDDFRREQVMDAVGIAGTSKLNRSHWRTVKAHFLALSGREDEAFALLQTTGLKTYRPATAEDTWETAETYVAQIQTNLADHAAIPVTHAKGHLNAGWFLAAARQRTGKPTLTMATLAERLDPETLCGLLSHLRNHISLREGRSNPDLRAKRTYPKPADPGEMDDPF